MAETLAGVNESWAPKLAGDKRPHSELVNRIKSQLGAYRERATSELARDAKDGLETTSDLSTG